MIFILWIVGFVICWILDDIRYKNILKKEEKTKQMEPYGLFDRHFHFVGGYIVITILLLWWLINKS